MRRCELGILSMGCTGADLYTWVWEAGVLGGQKVGMGLHMKCPAGRAELLAVQHIHILYLL